MHEALNSVIINETVRTVLVRRRSNSDLGSPKRRNMAVGLNTDFTGLYLFLGSAEQMTAFAQAEISLGKVPLIRDVMRLYEGMVTHDLLTLPEMPDRLGYLRRVYQDGHYLFPGPFALMGQPGEPCRLILPPERLGIWTPERVGMDLDWWFDFENEAVFMAVKELKRRI